MVEHHHNLIWISINGSIFDLARNRFLCRVRLTHEICVCLRRLDPFWILLELLVISPGTRNPLFSVKTLRTSTTQGVSIPMCVYRRENNPLHVVKHHINLHNISPYFTWAMVVSGSYVLSCVPGIGYGRNFNPIGGDAQKKCTRKTKWAIASSKTFFDDAKIILAG